MELARTAGALLSLDLCLPAIHRRRDLVLELLPEFELLFMNQDELRLLLPGYERDEALAELIARGAALVALKLGAHGCLVATRHTRLALAALEVDARDTNGCGDAFAAGFLWTYLRAGGAGGGHRGVALQGTLYGEASVGAPTGLLQCAALGNLLGGFTATRPGAADALPTLDELRALLASQPHWVGAATAQAVLAL
jgi:sugar/nucleoside kinase (ribokinase family)